MAPAAKLSAIENIHTGAMPSFNTRETPIGSRCVKLIAMAMSAATGAMVNSQII
jgi:hypothetical protein